MKACAIKGVKQFEIKEIKEPVADGKKVIIDVLKSGICGSDIHYWVNGEPKGLVMGHEFCGRVVDPGDRLDLQVGDRVTALPISPCGECEACRKGEVQYCSKTWSEALGLSIDNPGGLTSRIAVRSDMVIKVPDDMKDEEVAMVEPTAVGLHAAHLGRIAVGDDVLVIGGGIIGLVSAMFAKLEGASRVILTETNEERGRKSVKLGVADEWYNALDSDLVPKMMEKTHDGFDVVIECVGNSAAVNSAITLVKPGGIVVLVGVATDAVPTYTVMAVTKELVVQGAIAYTYDEFKSCIDLIADRKLNVMKFVDDVVPLDGVQKAYERLTNGKDSAIKIIVDPNK